MKTAILKAKASSWSLHISQNDKLSAEVTQFYVIFSLDDDSPRPETLESRARTVEELQQRLKDLQGEY